VAQPLSAPRPAPIDVSDEVLDDLRERLSRTRWPEQVEGSGWDYGVDIAYIRDLCEYWQTQYDWRAQERRLNEYPLFLCEVDGLDIHFWHVKGTGQNPLPLLLVHGWPGSIYEFLELIGPLSDPARFGGEPGDSFDLVIPSLPGFGFGGQPRVPGWGIGRIAAALDTLMVDVLGYPQYGVQGGDWGAVTARRLAAAHADHVVAIHSNLPAVAAPPGDLTEKEQATWDAHQRKATAEGGYSAIQGTKPDTLTVAQSDSPAGLAAWIVEKFRTWSDCGGDLESVYSKDDLLTNLMFYWAPNSTASAARIYFESFRAFEELFSVPQRPVGFAYFAADTFALERRFVEAEFPIEHWTTMPAGGHFAALEQPGLLVDDVRAFFRGRR